MTPDTIINAGVLAVAGVTLLLRDRQRAAQDAARQAKIEERLETRIHGEDRARPGSDRTPSGEIAPTVRDMMTFREWLKADIDAALAEHEVSLLDRFNGRYPSKDVFNAGMEKVGEQIIEMRKYIGDVKRELSAKIDGRISDLELRFRETEKR